MALLAYKCNLNGVLEPDDRFNSIYEDIDNGVDFCGQYDA